RHVRQPGEHLLEDVERIGELAESAGALGGAPPVADRLAPGLGTRVMMGEKRRELVEAIVVMALDRAADRFVQRLALVGEQAFVADLLRQHVRETMAAPRALARWPDQT